MILDLALMALVAAPGPSPQTTFVPSSCLPASASISNRGRLTAGDLDGDGFDGLLITDGGLVQWFRGTPAGVSTVRLIASTPGRSGGAVAVTPAGAPGGAAAYVALLPPFGGVAEIRIDRFEVGPSGGLVQSNLAPDLPGTTAELLFGDWTGDGVTDLVAITNAATEPIHVFEGDPAGTFGPRITPSVQGTPPSLQRPILADVDDDGDVDILAGNVGVLNPEVVLLRNQGAVGVAVEFLGGLQGLHTVQWGDLDVDGVEDIVFWAHDWGIQGQAGWIQRSPGGALGPIQPLPRGNSPLPYVNCTDFVVADFDGDGRTDWAQTQSNNDVFSNGHLTVAFNRGGGTFELAEISGLDNVSYIGDPQVTDIDRDGTPDLVGVNICDPINGGPFNCALNKVRPLIGESFCGQPMTNSTFDVGALRAFGSASVAANSLTLQASSLPPGEFGFLLASRSRQVLFPFTGSVGRLCMGGTTPIARFVRPGEVQSSGVLGLFEVPVDLTDLPSPLSGSAVLPGDTLYFQAWHRDGGTSPASGLTTAVAVTFQ